MVHTTCLYTPLLTHWTGQWCTPPGSTRPYSLTELVSGAHHLALHVPTHSLDWSVVHTTWLYTSLLTDWTGQWCTPPGSTRPYSLTGLVSGAHHLALHVPTHSLDWSVVHTTWLYTSLLTDWTGQWCTPPGFTHPYSLTGLVSGAHHLALHVPTH